MSIEINGDNLTVDTRDYDEDNFRTASYSFHKLVGTDQVAVTEQIDSGVDLLVMANGKCLTINEDTIVVYPTVQEYFNAWTNGDDGDNKIIDWYNDAGSKKHIDRLARLLTEDSVSEITGDRDLWEDIIHLNMDNEGVLPIPFKESFDEYTEWSEVEGGHYEFNRWIESIMYSMGHRFYKETCDGRSTKIHVPGL